MARGGARARSGPAPTSRERSHKAQNERADWTTLPAEGRDGPLPAFPLVLPTEREMTIWERLWETPQATQWEAQGQEFEVASYVRLLVRAEMPKSSSMIWAQVKQFAESLGLSMSGMQRNRWVVGTVEGADSDDDTGNYDVPSLEDRLRVINGG